MILEILFVLIAGHFICDFALQSEYMAIYKSPDTAVADKPIIWPWLLGGHSLIHGAAVYFITGSILLGIAEAFSHAMIDYLKCRNIISFHMDQLLHIGCKGLWAVIATSID